VPETIRAYFKRRTRRALQLCGVGAVLGASALALIAFGHVRAGELIGVAGVIVACGGIWYLDLTTCPRCLSRISATASSARLRHPVNFCPYCGASLDAERPSPR
jgi:hypothetical protein